MRGVESSKPSALKPTIVPISRVRIVTSPGRASDAWANFWRCCEPRYPCDILRSGRVWQRAIDFGCRCGFDPRERKDHQRFERYYASLELGGARGRCRISWPDGRNSDKAGNR